MFCHCSGADTVACAPLIDVETITLLQPTNGYLRVSQRGPFEETVVDTATLPSTAVRGCLTHLLHISIPLNVQYLRIYSSVLECIVITTST